VISLQPKNTVLEYCKREQKKIKVDYLSKAKGSHVRDFLPLIGTVGTAGTGSTIQRPVLYSWLRGNRCMARAAIARGFP
jgi:hypothetical protein